MDKNQLQSDYSHAESRLLLLDYDGVLAPIKPLPEQAAPEGRVKRLLEKLVADPRNVCVVISGRPRETLEDWLGDLPLSFAAEHGLWRRQPGSEWVSVTKVQTAWKQEIRTIMEKTASMLEGSFVEEKSAAIAFHYRNSPMDTAERVVPQLIALLTPEATKFSLRILEGKKVIELIPASVDKGMAALFWLEARQWDFILAVGDDITDEALFKAAPLAAYTVKVGAPPTAARMQIPSQASFVELLESLADLM